MDLKIEFTLHQQTIADMEQDLAPIISDHANHITETTSQSSCYHSS
jgi:hypothetical protein